MTGVHLNSLVQRKFQSTPRWLGVIKCDGYVGERRKRNMLIVTADSKDSSGRTMRKVELERVCQLCKESDVKFMPIFAECHVDSRGVEHETLHLLCKKCYWHFEENSPNLAC